MPRKTLTISLTSSLLEWIRQQAETSGHTSVSSYLRNLAVDDYRRRRREASAMRAIQAACEQAQQNGWYMPPDRRFGKRRRGQS